MKKPPAVAHEECAIAHNEGQQAAFFTTRAASIQTCVSKNLSLSPHNASLYRLAFARHEECAGAHSEERLTA